MIGVLIVSHGRVAEELLQAARTIVGDLPRAAAVSIGWSDDMNAARAAIERALHELDSGDGVLVLTDMFGGTPTNVSLPFLSERVEIVTGVNLPMLIKLSSLRAGKLCDVARAAAGEGQRHIYVASEILGPRPA